jgi:hypothetical protein
MKKKELIGVWKLVSYSWSQDNKSFYPFGEDALGYLIYTPQDYVSVHINLGKSQKQEDYGGYVGRYEMFDGYVIHYPEISSLSEYVEKPQIRYFQLCEDLLVIEHPEYQELFGEGTAKLVWRKV